MRTKQALNDFRDSGSAFDSGRNLKSVTGRKAVHKGYFQAGGYCKTDVRVKVSAVPLST